MQGKLKDKVAIVTGAGRGIGKEIALAYAGEGAAVCCVARNTEEINETANMIRKEGGTATAIPADVTDYSSMENMYRRNAELFGGLDILVINAGGNFERTLIEESNPINWEKTIHVNLIGAYYTAKLAIPYLKQRGGGKIITIGSGQGHKGSSANSAYSCSKAGLWMLTRILAQELREFNICVNELNPGPVVTDLTKNLAANRAGVFSIQGEWFKTPKDIIPLALFLAEQPDHGPTAQSFNLTRRDL